MIWPTMGGVTIGLLILGRFSVEWWPGRKALMKDPFGLVTTLLPFISGLAYGALGILSVSGLIGWFFDMVLWVANAIGDSALWLGVGARVGLESWGQAGSLTPQGSGVVLILTGIVLAVIKTRRCGRDVKRGTLAGLCLGASAGFAGLAASPLAEGANWLGGMVYGAVG